MLSVVRIPFQPVATSYLAVGIFIAPMIAGREPRGQHWLAYGLLGAPALVVFGSLFNEGRELVRSLEESPRAELGQFQRGLSLMLLALAAVVLLVEAFRHHQPAELLLLAAAFGPLLALSRRALRRWFKWGRYDPEPEL
jgi:putative copper export protein